MDLPAGFELDGVLRHVGRCRTRRAGLHRARPADRLAAVHAWELSLIGQNLLHAQHPEFQLASPTREEFQRGAYVRLVWRY